MSAKRDVYLVLGGDRYTGGHVVERLKARGDKVSVFDRTQREYHTVPFYQGDITKKEDVAQAIRKSGATCIIHTISPLSIRHTDKPQVFHDVNVVGTKNVIEAATEAGVRKLVYSSSTSVVLDGTDVKNGNESMPYAAKPLNAYARSRQDAERVVLAANGKNGLLTAVIRPSGAFGVGDRETIVGAYSSWKNGQTHVQLGDNQNLFDKVYVSNVALALVLAADKLEEPGVAGEVFFITNGEPWPFWDFMRALWAAMDEQFPDQRKPAKKPVVIQRTVAMVLAYVVSFFAWVVGKKDNNFTPYTVGFATMSMYFDDSKARRLLGYKPEVSVKEGIEKTMKWLKEEVEAGRPPC